MSAFGMLAQNRRDQQADAQSPAAAVFSCGREIAGASPQGASVAGALR